MSHLASHYIQDSFQADLRERIAEIEGELDAARSDGTIAGNRQRRLARAIRSIAGTAGWFGATAVRDLARSMASCLIAAEEPGPVPAGELIGLLADAAALLGEVADDPARMNEAAYETQRAFLEAAGARRMDAGRRRSLFQKVSIALPDGRPVFTCTLLDFEEAVRTENGGPRLVLLEFDRDRDILWKQKTPAEVIGDLTLLTALVDSRVEVDAEGPDEDPETASTARYFALVATTMGPGLIEDFFELDRAQIHLLPSDGTGLITARPRRPRPHADPPAAGASRAPGAALPAEASARLSSLMGELDGARMRLEEGLSGDDAGTVEEAARLIARVAAELEQAATDGRA